MSAWRRKAIALFPQLSKELNDPAFNVYQLYFELLTDVREAHSRGDEDLLRRIYGYAEWCLHQRTKELWNAAGVAFWEHLFDQREYWEAVIPWLSPEIAREIWPLWERRLDSADLAFIKELIEGRKDLHYQTNVYHSGEIEKV